MVKPPTQPGNPETYAAAAWIPAFVGMTDRSGMTE